jgi:hypothetical protein
MYFSAAACSENDHGSMNFASNAAPVASTRPSNVAAIYRSTAPDAECVAAHQRAPC